jgi:Flp pilus assembly protein TadD
MAKVESEVVRLRRQIERALHRTRDLTSVLPMLHRLSRVAVDAAAERAYAERHVAEILADERPWRATLFARRAAHRCPGDAAAWSTLAYCYVSLGHYRCAVSAYRRALELAPRNEAYAHNLGHLLDVALGRPEEALPWLEVAYEGTRRRADVAVSFAHALGRVGRLGEARRVVRRALQDADRRCAKEHSALLRWLGSASRGATVAVQVRPIRSAPPVRSRPELRGARRGERGAARGLVDAALRRGLARLPMCADQRRQALVVGREVLSGLGAEVPASSAAGLAAAVAYAIAWLGRVPISQAEVAASFRVSVAELRGWFKTLRPCLVGAALEANVAGEVPR